MTFMKTVPLLPATAPFTPEQRAWINGYLAGLFQNLLEPSESVTSAASTPLVPLLLLYGSQTGSAEGLTKKLAKKFKESGFAPKIHALDEFARPELAVEERVLIITSTYGDGEPPDNGMAFWDFIKADSAPRLEKAQYAILALGDTNYAQFCEYGKKLDARFEQLGAKRIIPRIDCDGDYEAPSEQWFTAVLSALGSAPSETLNLKPQTLNPTFDKSNPFPAKLITNYLLNAPGSAKEVRHIEIDLTGSDLHYETGDALGLYPQNNPALVEEILQILQLDGEEAVPAPDKSEVSLRLALLKHYDLKKIEESWPPVPTTATEFVAGLKKMAPRLYSISSSPKAHPNQVHLTVGIVRYESNGRARQGVCSTFLADRVTVETPLPIYFHHSPHFRLPTDLTKPVIMVGPGTGIAPFRAFLEEREATGATGKNWLLFGDQKSSTDFLYREQLESWVQSSLLHRLDTAFSRDQAEKIYVQHRMIEHAAELWAWLQEGAYFYVCGDANRMAKDVDAALHQVCEQQGGLSPEAASDYVKKLKAEKRYARDVY